MAIKPVELEKFYRLINHSPTVMVSAKADNIENVMSASWCCALDFAPKAKLTVVLDKISFTRLLIEKSGYFAIQVPFAKQAQMVMGESYKTNLNKLADNGVALFYQTEFDVPMVKDCAAYIVCKLTLEPHNQQEYNLFIGEMLTAWADDRVFRNGHWEFDDVSDELKNLHYVAGGQFYITGKSINIQNN